jgi:hypothetical protein
LGLTLDVDLLRWLRVSRGLSLSRSFATLHGRNILTRMAWREPGKESSCNRLNSHHSTSQQFEPEID